VGDSNLDYNCSPIRREKRNCILFTGKGNITIAEWLACAPTSHVVVRSCRKSDKHWHAMFIAVIFLNTLVRFSRASGGDVCGCFSSGKPAYVIYALG
jgi:hypothetical protein